MAKSVNVIIVLAMVVAGVGLGLYFVVPAAHSLSLPIAGMGVGVEVVSLITRVSLWFIPWLSLGLIVAGGVFLLYEAYRNRARFESVMGSAHSVSSYWCDEYTKLRDYIKGEKAAVVPPSTAPVQVQIVHP